MNKLITALICLLLAIPCAAKVIYVDADANGLNNGSSWSDAYKYLQDALVDANSSTKPVEICVAQGIYKPSKPPFDPPPGQPPPSIDPRMCTFLLKSGVVIKGGYAGFGQPDPNDRNIELYETILSGDRAGNDIDVNVPCDLLEEPRRIDNFFHVVTASGTDDTAILDGFTIRGGNANETAYGGATEGGGMYNNSGNPKIINCIFRDNAAARYGGGIFNNNGSSPMLTNCTFSRNWAWLGGGVYSTICASDKALVISDSTFCGNFAELEGGGMWGCGAELSHCVFKQNESGWGGAMFIDGDTNLINCLFAGNSAYIGGVSYAYDDLTVSNCTFAGNRAYYVGGISSNEGYTIVTNSIFWENTDSAGAGESAEIGTWEPPTINYCCILGWTGDLGGIGNTGADPCFAKPGYWDANGTPEDANDDFWVDGDYHLKSQAGRWDPAKQAWIKDDVTSLCTDAGDPSSPIGLEPFPNGGIINMGAYGGTAEASKSYFGKPVCETIIAGDVNGDCKIDYQDVFFLSLNWLADNRQE